MKEQDCFRRFLFEELGIRGEWVRLNNSWQEVKKNQLFSVEAQEKLGHALASSVLLSATIKFEGSLILQVQGDGAIKTMVAQSTHDRKIRGLIRGDESAKGETIKALMGDGRLVITVEPDEGEPYQGIIALEGEQFSDLISHYFNQSEQLKTRVWLFADETQVAGLFLQELPSEENDQDDWERIETLADTVTKEELFTLDCEEILYRLFNEERVRVFSPETVQFECSCSSKKIESTLISLGRDELFSILKERGTIDVGCEFCGENYVFDKVDIEGMLTSPTVAASSETRH